MNDEGKSSELCPICAQKGITSRKRWLQLNFNEVIYCCENIECTEDLVTAHDVNSIIVTKNSDNSIAISPLKKFDSGSKNNVSRKEMIPPTDDANNSGKETSADDLSNFLFAMETNNGNAVDQVCPTQPQIAAVENVTSEEEIIASPDKNEEAKNPIENKLTSINTPTKITTAEMALSTSIASSAVTTNNIPVEYVTTNNSQFMVLPMAMTQLIPLPQLPNDLVVSIVQAQTQLPLRKIYPQWCNRDNLCWLDVTLNLIIHNSSVQKELACLCDNSIVKTVITNYNELIPMLNSKTPQKPTFNLQAVGNSQHVSENGLADPVTIALEQIRDKTFDYLKTKLGCLRGQEESPVFALPHLLQEESLQKNFLTHCVLEFECDACKYRETRSTQKIVLTLPRVSPDFTVLNATIMAPCCKCNVQNQKRKLKFEKLSNCLIMHFVEGLPCSDVLLYEFVFKSLIYKVTCVVQYKQNPNHFTAWIRDLKDNLWMECDDLKLGPSSFNMKAPVLTDGSECHVLVWEYVQEATPSDRIPEVIPATNDVINNSQDQKLEHLFDHLYMGEIPNDFNQKFNDLMELQKQFSCETPTIKPKPSPVIRHDYIPVTTKQTTVVSQSDRKNVQPVVTKSLSVATNVTGAVNAPITFSRQVTAINEPKVFPVRNRIPIYNVNAMNSNSKGNPADPAKRNLFPTILQPQSKEMIGKMSLIPTNISECTLHITTNDAACTSGTKQLTLSCENAIQLLKALKKQVSVVVTDKKYGQNDKPSISNNNQFSFPTTEVSSEVPSRGSRRGRGGRARAPRARGSGRGRGKSTATTKNRRDLDSSYDSPLTSPESVTEEQIQMITDSPIKDNITKVDVMQPVELSATQCAVKQSESIKTSTDASSVGEIVGKRKATTPLTNATVVKKINGTSLNLVMNSVPSRRSRLFGSYQPKAVTEN